MRSYHDLLSRRERGVIDAKGKSVGSVRNIKLVEPVDIIQDICRILQATVADDDRYFSCLLPVIAHDLGL